MFGLQKIISAEQTRHADLYTIKNEPISSMDLMERASLAFVEEFLKYEVVSKTKIAVVCGVGNNGGDGFAITRLLLAKGFDIHPFLIQIKDELSADCQTNSDRLHTIDIITGHNQVPSFDGFDIIIDAIFGTGLNSPVRGFTAEVITAINNSSAKVYSVDLTSGLFSDEITVSESVIKSDVTISFQRPKKAFFYPENNEFIKSWKVVNIGLNEGFIQNQASTEFILDDIIANRLKTRERYSHKGTYGHAMIISGSYGKIGATVLTTKACLRSGAGLVTTYLPKCGYEILQTSAPEAMCITDSNQEYITELPGLESYKVIGVGPGIGTHLETSKALRELLESNIPMVLDADALNIISRSDNLLKKIPEGSILTPHIKEFDRLFGASATSQERYDKQREFSKTHKIIIVLKDAHTCISDTDGNLYFNTSGNPGMATGGSGDVLTGIITGLISQSYSAIESALLGVYFHGKAGDKASQAKGEMSLIVSDLIDHLKIQR